MEAENAGMPEESAREARLTAAVTSIVLTHLADDGRADALIADLVREMEVILRREAGRRRRRRQPAASESGGAPSGTGKVTFEHVQTAVHSVFGGGRRGVGWSALVLARSWPMIAATLVPYVREIAGDEAKMQAAEVQLQKLLARYMEPARARAVAAGLIRMARTAATRTDHKRESQRPGDSHDGQSGR